MDKVHYHSFLGHPEYTWTISRHFSHDAGTSTS